MQRATHNLDAQDQIAGRLASRIAVLLQGKNKPSYQPHTDCGDIVIVSNTAGMRFTGKKLTDKVYHRSSGYPGGIKTTKLADLFANKPDDLLRGMVFRMLPKNKLRNRMIKRLRFTKKATKK